MNKPINFETSKLLKEKGIRILPDFESSYPTISEVIMWLYEKHGIWIMVNIAIDNLWYFELYDLKAKRNDEIHISWGDSSNFITPTKAYEKAIEYTLNNLI